MLDFSTRKHYSSAFVLLFSLLSACSNSSPAELEKAVAPVQLTPYLTATQAPQQVEQKEDLPLTETPALSPTPFFHTIVASDTLLGIAQRYAISLEALLAANPGVSANFLSIGLEIRVPQGEATDLALLAQATLPPLDVGESTCYTTAVAELWCLLLVHNDLDIPLESLVAEIILFSAIGEKLDSAEASAPLNLLRPGEAMPLLAYWPSPPEGWQTSTGSLITAYQVTDTEGRYITTSLPDTNIRISDDGLSARVTGTLDSDTLREASLIWLLAVAYDSDNNVLGFRRWEGVGETNGFEFWVYSLAGQIEKVDLLIEARP